MPHDPASGRVLLVGAGPGPVDLLTLRALRAVEGAQALLYDALVGEEILALAPAACLRIQTGKRAGRASMKQATINRLMLKLARRGLRVVRLKGGDPSIFGRVGEESAFLKANDVPVEIVPGVTAACAAAAQFDFPLTHRAVARRVVFTTARVESGALVGDWSAAGDTETTMAIYMGGHAAGALSHLLISAGRPAETPAMVVENAGRDDAKVSCGALSALASLAASSSRGPVMIIVGDVVEQAPAFDEAKRGEGRADQWQAHRLGGELNLRFG